MIAIQRQQYELQKKLRQKLQQFKKEKTNKKIATKEKKTTHVTIRDLAAMQYGMMKRLRGKFFIYFYVSLSCF